MKNFLIIIILSISLYSFSQEEKDNYDKVAKSFMMNYNEANYQAVYNMFDDTMKQALPEDKTELFLKDLNAKLGEIRSMEFNRYEKVAHVYKTTFTNELRDILMYLDPETNLIAGLLITYHKPANLPKLKRNITKMILPFKEEWYVFWGGTSVDKNYHVAYDNQKYAYDIMIVENGISYKGDSKKNENYYVFGKDIIAPCDAKVVKVITGVHDNIPGELNPAQLTGNSIVLETTNKEYLLFAHLKEASVVVKVGQEVKQGELLGKCGNSGNTTEPHLHLSLQNVVDMNIATGGKLFFDKIKVNGEIKEDYLPEKNDKIQNIKL